MSLPLADLLFNVFGGDECDDPAYYRHSTAPNPAEHPAGTALPADHSDQPLVTSVRSVDDATAYSAFETLYRTWYEPLCDFALIYVRRPDAAGDIVDEVFANIWTARDRWMPARGIGAYLRGAVRNRIRNFHRDAMRADTRDAAVLWTLGDSPAEPPPEDAIDMVERLARVWRAVEALSPMRRTALTLRWQQGLEINEIARLMDIREGAVRVHLTRGIAQLREMLGDAGV